MAANSILDSTKRSLGIEESYSEFDEQIVMCINTTFSILRQLNVGPEEGFSISDNSTVWTDFIGGSDKLELVKTYVSQKVRLMFDPPSSSIVTECINKTLSEIEYRILLTTDITEE